jgi:hypothetical protein
VLGDTEEHDGWNPERDEAFGLCHEGFHTVLDDTWHREDRLRLGDALADEQRRDQVVNGDRWSRRPSA